MAAAVGNPSWQGSDGVTINSSQDTDFVCLVRGLLVAYNRNPTNKALRNYLKGFLAVQVRRGLAFTYSSNGSQYNAILDQATIAGSNIYVASWTGPPATTFQLDNQTVSLMGLLSSIYLVNDTETSPTTNTTSSGNGGNGGWNSGGSNNSTSSSKVAPIVGGIVGGLAFIVILAALILRRRRRLEAQVLVVPFMTRLRGAVRIPHGATKSSNPTFGKRYTPHSVPIRREKQVFHRHNPAVAMGQQAGTSTSNTIQAPNPRPAPSGDASSSSGAVNPRVEQLPTYELVRLLNERLQSEAWDEDELPPQYPSTG